MKLDVSSLAHEVGMQILRPCQDGPTHTTTPWRKISFPFSNLNAFVFTSRRPSMMHRLSLMNISLFTTMIAFNLTPSSLLSKNGVSLRNPSLSYQRWFYFCLFLLEQFNCRWFPFTNKFPQGIRLGGITGAGNRGRTCTHRCTRI